ncbi:hypothetical protein NO263_13100 [Gluconacetobacter entanii]|uniref:Putative tail fiber protein gp53-like C-terminal domain-containing protein n=1 Tax=Gluconacetobacter entanii TaxID=108528 RepID=A0ABT3K822_9PROT|nr:hypothetical protein [Gluconacetobacter entanii]MCW4591519.1 hypothetical protein [Gluconacetobacter entanii]MCW4595437.1 hypothetical protein [Gluconacetobacter entanii]NPC89866.1 hypothetical protein [Gluconacetobacter entanii]
MVYQIDDATAVASLPALPTDNIGTPGFFTGGSTSGGAPTRVRYWWLNMVQEELRNLVIAANLTPDKTNNAQVLAALRSMFVTLGGGKYQVAGTVMLGRDTTFPGLRYSYIGADGETVEDGGYLVSSYGTLLSGSTQVGDLTIGPDGRLSYQSVKMAGSYSVTALLSDIVAGTGLGNSQGTNGYQILPGGTVLQYGANSSGSGGYSTPNFPVAFPTKCEGMIVVESAATTNWAAGKPTLHGVQGYPSKVQADVYSMIFSGSGGGWGGMNGLGYFWWAWGY